MLCILPWLDDAVIDPEQENRCQPDRGDGEPSAFGMVRDLAEVMHHASAEPAANQRTDPDGQKRESHVRPLLSSRREARNVFIVARLLRDFAEGQDKNRENRAEHCGLKSNDEPSERRDERSENDRLKSRDLADQIIHDQSERDDDQGIGDQHELDIGTGADVAMDIAGERDELLPENDPIASEDEEKQHEFRVGQHGEEISQRRRHAWRVFVDFALWFAEEKQDGEEHGKDAEGGDAEDVFDAKMAVRPGSDIRASRAADVHHGVVDGVADGADVFLGGASRCAHDAGFYERNAERGKKKNKAAKEPERTGIATRRKPGCSYGAIKK